MSAAAPALRILLADDHDLIRLEMRELLEQVAGWQVAGEARDGRQAIDLALRLRPDVAVLDLSMPGIGGLDVARRIRTGSPATEILICTMHEGDEIMRTIAGVGARGLLLKSDAPRQIVAAVRAVSCHQPYFAPQTTEAADSLFSRNV
jgi:DNA-binding NarL/FixJ family response regulator